MWNWGVLCGVWVGKQAGFSGIGGNGSGNKAECGRIGSEERPGPGARRCWCALCRLLICSCVRVFVYSFINY